MRAVPPKFPLSDRHEQVDYQYILTSRPFPKTILSSYRHIISYIFSEARLFDLGVAGVMLLASVRFNVKLEMSEGERKPPY